MTAKSHLVLIVYFCYGGYKDLVKCNCSLYTAQCCELFTYTSISAVSYSICHRVRLADSALIYSIPEHAAGLWGRQPAAWSPIALVWQHITAIRRCRIQNIQVGSWSRCTLFLMLVGLPLENGALVHVQTGPSWMNKIAKISWERNTWSCSVCISKLIFGKENQMCLQYTGLWIEQMSFFLAVSEYECILCLFALHAVIFHLSRSCFIFSFIFLEAIVNAK